MELNEAEEVINKFTKALAISEGLIVYPISLLKRSNRQLVIDAYKVLIPHIKDNIIFENLMNCVISLYHFLPDKEARKINAIDNKKRRNKRITSQEKDILERFLESYAESMANGIEAYNEIREFLNNN